MPELYTCDHCGEDFVELYEAGDEMVCRECLSVLEYNEDLARNREEEEEVEALTEDDYRSTI